VAIVGSCIKDLSLSIRRLRIHRKFTLGIGLQLAFGTAIFILVHTILTSLILKPLPFPSQQRLIMLWEQNDGKALLHQPVAPDKFRAWAAQLTSVENMAAFRTNEIVLDLTNNPQVIRAETVSATFWSLFQITPVIGRILNASDSQGIPQTAVISESLWRSRYNSSATVVGSTVALGDRQYIIVGVARSSLFPTRADVWIPLSASWHSRVAHSLKVVGLLRAGWSIKECRSELASITRESEIAFPDTDRGWTANATPLRMELLGNIDTAMKLAWGVSLVLLLLVCFNVATLMMVRFRSRLGEASLRIALGATRLQVLTAFLGEPLILSICGTLGGLLIARLCLHPIATTFLQARLQYLPPIAMSWSIVLLSLVLPLLCVIITGVLPAFQLSSVQPQHVLLSYSHSSRTNSRSIRLLIFVEITISVCLALCAGVAFTSLSLLRHADLGFNTKKMTAAQFSFPRGLFMTQTTRNEFMASLMERARRLSGTVDVALTSNTPLRDSSEPFNFLIEGHVALYHSDQLTAEYRAVSPSFFHVMEIPLLEGHIFDQSDPLGLVINEKMAERYWPRTLAIGQRISIDGPRGPWRTVIGIVGNTRDYDIAQLPTAQMYFPITEESPWSVTLLIKNRSPSIPSPNFYRLFASINPVIKPYHVESVESSVRHALIVPAAESILFSACAIAGLFLASLGMYSLMSASLSRKIHDIAIRLALGAPARHIVANVAMEGLYLSAGGTAAGAVIGLVIAKAAASHLYGVKTWSLSELIVATICSLLVNLIACLIPALRATHVKPSEALRQIGE
jgi:predicted permease